MDNFLEFTFTQKTNIKYSNFTEVYNKKTNEISIYTPIPVLQGERVIGVVQKMEFIDEDTIKASGVIWSREATFSFYEDQPKSFSFDSLHLNL